MRLQKSDNGLTAMATAGSYVVLVGWDMDEAVLRQRGILGFSLQRKRHEDGEIIWLGGMKSFEAVEPDPIPGELVSTFDHPL